VGFPTLLIPQYRQHHLKSIPHAKIAHKGDSARVHGEKMGIDLHTDVRVYDETAGGNAQKEDRMKIGELSKATGVSLRSLRYYEEQGLLQPERMENGYRVYSPFAVEQVHTIQLYLRLGLSTEQIVSFLHCVLKNKEAFCREIMPVYESKLKEIDEQIDKLLAIRSNLIERIEAIRNESSASELEEQR